MRLPFVPVLAVLLVAVPTVPALPALPAAASDATPLRVTAVVQDAHGHLRFRHGSARGLAAAKGLASKWRSDPGVVAADVEHRLHISGSPDPLAPAQWALSALHATQVGDATGQVVAVVDTGVDATHPDLAGVVLAGTDVVNPGGDGRSDPNGHGTHVAGIVAALRDNNIGGAGLAQGAKILPVRVMAADGTGYTGDAAYGVVWAVDHGAGVINLSLGGPDRDAVMDQAVQYALSHGVSVVVAAGNDATSTADPVEWPAADPGVLAVGAVDAAGLRPSWSSSGSHLAVAAPGVGILSTVPVTTTDPTGYATWSGTSMAAPFVSAAAALLRTAVPTLTAAGVRARLMATADDLGATGFDPLYGAGLVDVVSAEGAATAADPPMADPLTPAMTARISSSRPATPYAGAVSVSTRVLADGAGMPGLNVELLRLVNGAWVPTRAGVTGAGGLTGWVLHPDRTTSYRTVGNGWQSPLLQIAVTPVLTLRAGASGATGRVLPTGSRTVRIDRRSGTSWVAVTSVTSAGDGTFGLARRFAVGTVLRAVVSGVASAAARVG